jgi:glycerol-3-phosphate dehydrogenase (NAD(P)+)
VKNLAIIGAGAWGTALSAVLAPRFSRVRLWVYEADLAIRMAHARDNDTYLPGCRLPPNVEPVNDFAAALEAAEIVLSVMPSHLVRQSYERMLPFLDQSMLFVSATKGLENGTLLRMSEIIEHVLTPAFPPQIAVISGPSFAREVARFEPTALVVASASAPTAAAIQASFSGPTFRLYTTTDVAGVELGGSIKNVIALGAGVLGGLELGHNALAALITRGLAEMTRLALAMGAKPHTLAGLAGLGDLVLTCNGDLSRNRAVGVALAHGRKLDEIVSSMNAVAEGIKTTNAVVDLAHRYHVEMPISEQVYLMLHSGLSPREAIRALMERSLKGE